MSACACGGRPPGAPPARRASILLVTLDTTRADAVGPDAAGQVTPSFNALAQRARRFRQAYATAPETLPSHVSMMTGLYPAGHGIRENGRHLGGGSTLLAERLQQAGYATAAFVSSFVLARRFGLARGFDVYDDELPPGSAERTARPTTERALAYLTTRTARPLFLWVHFFDPHHPYEPPEPYRERHAGHPYLGEVAAMDAQLGRLVQAFETRVPAPRLVIVVGDHGEGLGDHGEARHGNLLYQATMRVPLLVAADDLPVGVNDAPVSVRRVFHTILDAAGVEVPGSLRAPLPEPVLGEALRPYLSYGWQPQVMAVQGRHKVIRTDRLEVYDVRADPGETRDLGPRAAGLPRELRQALQEYPLPSLERPPPEQSQPLGDEERRQLAALGYVGAAVRPQARAAAPRPADMVHLFEVIDQASGLFVREEYARAVPLLERILAADPHNLDAALRLATAHSSLGDERQALAAFESAATIAPHSPDVRAYLAMHRARGADWKLAVPDLEQLVAESPDRLPALEALALVRERQERIDEALDLRLKIQRLRRPTRRGLLHLARLAMSRRRTPLAIESFERLRALEPDTFAHDLDLGVLYLAARRFEEARQALDRVPASHPERPMVLFKRAQVSVLLGEPDRASRIRAAREGADETTRGLIANERLFRDP